jgi:hypothetical protein
MKMEVQIPLQHVSFPLHIYPEVWFLDHMVFLFLIFRSSVLFSKMFVQIYISSNSVQRFQFPYILVIIDVLTSVRGYLVMVLICISLIITVVQHFSYARWPIVWYFWRNTYLGHCSFLVGIFEYLAMELYVLIMYFGN